MPELPEVEVTRRRIAPLLVGRRVARVHTSRPSYFFLTPPSRLRRGLEGRALQLTASISVALSPPGTSVTGRRIWPPVWPTR